jgi:hypothetical protein
MPISEAIIILLFLIVIVFLWEISVLIGKLVVQPATAFRFEQIIGGNKMAITGTVPGATSTFTGTPNGALQPGNIPTWTVDDPNVTLTPGADGLSVSAATLATDTATSYNLTQSGVNSAGIAISTTVNVPFLPAPPAPATGFNINQTS